MFQECFAKCGDAVMSEEKIETKKLVVTNGCDPKKYCYECFMELVFNKLPKITDGQTAGGGRRIIRKGEEMGG